MKSACNWLVIKMIKVGVLWLYFIANTASVRVSVKCRQSGGSCKVVTECPVALEALGKGHFLKLERCGFTDDEDEIVCCPNNTLGTQVPGDDRVRGRFSGKNKSIEVCEQYQTAYLAMPELHVLNGTNVTDNEFPHMAALGYQSGTEIEWSCGGTLISRNFILTAAHCMDRIGLPTLIRMGARNIDDKKVAQFTIKSIKSHENYSLLSRHNDIAVIELNEQVTFSSSIFPACLYTEEGDPDIMIVTGWGNTKSGQEESKSKFLLKALLSSSDLEACNKSYLQRSFGDRVIEVTQLCAHSDEADTCGADSGGPIQIKLRSNISSVVGITSYGSGCGGNAPGIYTRVSKYLDWIEERVWS